MFQRPEPYRLQLSCQVKFSISPALLLPFCDPLRQCSISALASVFQRPEPYRLQLSCHANISIAPALFVSLCDPLIHSPTSARAPECYRLEPYRLELSRPAYVLALAVLLRLYYGSSFGAPTSASGSPLSLLFLSNSLLRLRFVAGAQLPPWPEPRRSQLAQPDYLSAPSPLSLPLLSPGFYNLVLLVESAWPRSLDLLPADPSFLLPYLCSGPLRLLLPFPNRL